MLTKTLSFFSWNVRGLGQASRCEDVLSELLSSRPSFVALQETKLQHTSALKAKTFLPKRLSSWDTINSTGASGGILSAWDNNLCSCTLSHKCRYSLTTTFTLTADGSLLSLTNVYAPTKHDEKRVFLSEMANVADTISGPWIVIGDFNLVRDPSDKNTPSFDASEVALFNDLINNIG